MDKKYIFADFAPTHRQQLFEEVKNKAVKCTNLTQLCAAIYPYILHVVCEYTGRGYNILEWQRAADCFKSELYGFRQALSVYVRAAIPLMAPSIRNDILDEVIDVTVDVARIETAQNCVKLSAIMARFVEDL